jgi:hypothetical protein
LLLGGGVAVLLLATDAGRRSFGPVKKLPTTDIALKYREARSGLGRQLIPDHELLFEYKGAEQLEEVDLEVRVSYPNDVEQRLRFPKEAWQPNTEVTVRFPETFAGEPQRVVLCGSARIGKGTVRVAQSWRFVVQLSCAPGAGNRANNSARPAS